ncbi:MAG: DUF1549 and DUF1553 domain-containing protein [Planctomycetales bacterium]|nr:DUF1549 and DUF1553 domain-containing protein [Planctomycetales bacterium]
MSIARLFAPTLKLFAAAMLVGSSASGEVVKLELSPVGEGDLITIRSRDARQQLIATAVHADGTLTDVTRDVTWTISDPKVLAIDSTGMAVPTADGEIAVTAALADKSVVAKVAVSGFAHPLPINFRNQIVPIFTKLGCNGGGCHGKSGGQNGFKLSLLGFVAEDDYEFLRKESRGRRIFPAIPGESLLIKKAIGRSPHGGGKRMDQGSYEYNLMVQWIEQGMPYGADSDPYVVGIKCIPETRVMQRKSQQQISVIATYSDGTTEDVTRMALFEPNEPEMAESSTKGLVTTLDLSGEVAIMARYQGQVATFRATVPLGADTSKMPEPINLVDAAVFGKLKQLGIPASDVCDDATFLRRVSLDISGTLPSEEEVRLFLADASADKRDRLIDRLLDGTAYADHFANKWNFVLRNKKEGADDAPGTMLFHQWLWNRMYDNTPYDQFVREIVTASGDPQMNPAVVWYRDVDSTEEQVEDTAQLFLGLRIQCARCHHHPFEKWSQDDYYGMAAFYGRVGKKAIPNVAGTMRDKRVFHNEGVATASNPRTGKALKPTGLGTPAYEIAADSDPRVKLADWMSDPKNPFFAKSLVNRYWKHFFSRGIVEPEDDMRETNPPANPELLNALSDHFIKSGFDMKELIRTICRSRTYQLSALPNEHNASDKQNFSRYYPRRLSAEVLYDAFHVVTETSENFGGMPAGTKAMQLVDSSSATYFLQVFGQPKGDTACECERSMDANLAQSLHLLNGREIQDKIARDGARTAKLAADTARPDEERVKELYRWVFAREPNAEELEVAIAYIKKHSDNVRRGYEDVVWALINTKEFQFNH